MNNADRRYGHARLLLVSTLAVMALVANAGTAAAKVIDLHRVTIRGAELRQPLVLNQKEFGIPRSQSDPRMVAAFGLFDADRREARPSGELGVSFEVTYEYRSYYDGEPRFFRVREVLYPHAESGPVAFAPAGQTWRVGTDTAEQEVPTGWRPYPVSVVRDLQAHGLPVVGPARLNAESEQARPPWAWLLIPAVVAYLGIAARVYRKRSSIAPA